MSGMKIKICYAFDDQIGNEKQKKIKEQCVKLFSQDIFSSLKRKIDDLGGLSGFDSVKRKDDFDIAVGDPAVMLRDFKKIKNYSEHPVPAILFLYDDAWGEDVSTVLSSELFDVRGVFLASRLWPEETRDIEDFASLASLMKEIIRQNLRARRDASGRPLLHEEDLSKKINWKVTVKNKKDLGFISLFSDPSMQGMAREYKDALRSLKRGIIDEFRKNIKPFSELKVSNSKENKENYDGRLKEYYKNINNFIRKRAETHEDYNLDAGIKIPSLLLLGETGCGKSLLARAASKVLTEGNFFRANIAAYPENSIDTFLFGSVNGSYTGSEEDMPGAFIYHCGGTVFLDEIGDMNLESQTRLLTYMDDGKVTPLGMNDPILAPCILIAATNKDITNSKSSDFRQDIVHRFDHVIKIPSLKERKQDLRLLISLTLQDDKINPFIDIAINKRRVERISLDAIKCLEAYDFPGNYRELEFILRQAVNNAFADGSSCICFRHIYNKLKY